MIRKALTLAVLVAVTALAAERVPAQAPRTLVVQASTEPPGLDLTASPASAIAAVVHYNVQEGLVKVDRTGALVPWLAERWETTDDRTFTFHLRKGVRFHNGRAFTAADVRFVIERAMHPETKHPHPGHFASIAAIVVKDDHRQSEVALEDRTRRALYAQMQALLAEEAPVVWLYVHPRLVVTRAGVEGVWKDLPIPALDLSEVSRTR